MQLAEDVLKEKHDLELLARDEELACMKANREHETEAFLELQQRLSTAEDDKRMGIFTAQSRQREEH